VYIVREYEICSCPFFVFELSELQERRFSLHFPSRRYSFRRFNGADLFPGGSTGHFIDSVRLYYMLNGVKTMVNNNRSGYIPASPYGVIANMMDSSGGSTLGIETNYNITNDSSTIFIDLKPGKEDTLSCAFTQFDRVLTLAWYDRMPKLTAADKYNNYFTVMER
jgi:hypothetical protein